MNDPTLQTIVREACYGIPPEEIARRCGVDVATARRWKRGARCAPWTAIMILREDLGCFDPASKGWRIRDGKLVSPEGWAVTTSDVMALPLMRAQLAAYQAEQRRVQAIEEQPEPGAGWGLVPKALRG